MPRARTADAANHGTDREKRKGKRGDRYAAPFSGWCNYTPKDDDREAFERWYEAGLFYVALEDTILNGLKYSLTYQWDESCFIATAFQRDAESVNAGVMISARSSDAHRALCKLVWTILILLPAEWPLAGRGRTAEW